MVKIKIFIDSSIIKEIKEADAAGVLDGVTTNPSLIKKAVEEYKKGGKSINIEEYIKEILLTAKGRPVSLEVIGPDFKKMVREGKKLFKMFNPIAGNVYVKIPVNPSLEAGEDDFAGIKAIKELSGQNIPINCTLVFTPEQALLAAKAGANFVSPFAGRIDDHIRSSNNISFEKSDYFPADGIEKDGEILDDNGIISGVDLVAQIADLFESHSIKNTEVLAASIRNTRQAREAALVGADIATLPINVISDLLKHDKTREGMEKFMGDVVPEYRGLLED